MDQMKKCLDKMGLIPTQIMVAYLEINAFPMGKSLFSCHIERILPPPVLTLSWFDTKCHRMEKSMYSLWILNPSVPQCVPRNETALHRVS